MRSTGRTGAAAGIVSFALWLLPFCFGALVGPIIVLAGLLFAMPVITMSLVLAAHQRNR